MVLHMLVFVVAMGLNELGFRGIWEWCDAERKVYNRPHWSPYHSVKIQQVFIRGKAFWSLEFKYTDPIQACVVNESHHGSHTKNVAACPMCELPHYEKNEIISDWSKNKTYSSCNFAWRSEVSCLTHPITLKKLQFKIAFSFKVSSVLLCFMVNCHFMES